MREYLLGATIQKTTEFQKYELPKGVLHTDTPKGSVWSPKIYKRGVK